MYDNHKVDSACGCHININYDEIGNPLNWRNASSLTWNGRQLDSLSTPQLCISYTYNSDGIRTRRVIEGTTVYDYVLDGTKILCETVTSNSTELYKYYYLYDEKGSVIGFQDGTATYYYQKNLQGDIIRILNSAGTVLVEYTYNAFGEVLSVTGSLASTIGQRNPFRYRGYYYDKETGFYYLNSRYYDPTVGRFLNADAYTSTGQGILGNNMFACCGNNPILISLSDNCSFQKTSGLNRTNETVVSEPFFYVPNEEYAKPIRIFYDVPLYNQGANNQLCWAFCQVMIEDYRSGIISTNDQATDRAIEIAIKYHRASGIEDRKAWNKPGWPRNAYEPFYISGLNELYDLLVLNGPVYACYFNSKEGHLVIVTGVDLNKGLVYTNNPWGVSGAQTYEQFVQGFLNMPSYMAMRFDYCITIK